MNKKSVENNKRKKAGKKEISHIASMYLKSYGIKMNRETEIVPVINAVIFAMNELLKNDFEINLRGFGNFLIQDVKRTSYKIGKKEYISDKKRRVHFKYLNKVFK